MGRKKRTLSTDDQKAIDLILDSAAGTRHRMTRVATAAVPSRITAATKILSLLNELPAIDPPKNLVAKTMEFIDEATGQQVSHRSRAAVNVGAHLH